MIILITGGLGYLGGRITEFLKKNTCHHLRITTRNVPAVCQEGRENTEIFRLDLSSGEGLIAACHGVRMIIHLAALNENESQKDFEASLLINGLGTLRLLKAAETTGVERFIFFSTAHVYGSPLKGRITEDKLPRPIHPYAISHKTAEDYVLAAHEKGTLTGIVLRVSNGFGRPVSKDVRRWTLIVNDLCRQIVLTRKIVLRSSGNQRRDFITISDICRAVEHFMNLPADQCGNGLFNLGGECSLQIIEMANIIAERCYKLFGFRPEIVRSEPYLPEYSDRLEYCVDKLKSTGFLLTKNIVDEIDSTLVFCRENFGMSEND